MTSRTFLLQHLLAHKRKVIGVCFLDFAANVVSLFLPILLAQSYSLLLHFDSARGRWLAQYGIPVPQTFLEVVSVLGLLVSGKGIIEYIAGRQRGRLLEQLLYAIRNQLFAHQLRMDSKIYEAKGSGRYLLRFSGDLSSVQQLLAKGILQFISDAILLVLGLVLMFLLQPELGMVILGVLVVSFALIRILNRQLMRLETEKRNRKSAMLAFVNTRLMHIHSLKVQNKYTPEEQSFERQSMRVKEVGIGINQWLALRNAGIPMLTYTLFIVILLVSYIAIQRGSSWPSDRIFAIIMLLLSWNSLFSRLLKVGTIWRKGQISVTKLTAVLNTPSETGLDIPDVRFKAHHLHIDQLQLSSGENADRISLILKKGQREKVFFSSSHDYTMFIRVLAGLERPVAGDIRLGEHWYSTLSPKSIRRKIAFISPVFPLYGKNVVEAITYSKRHRAEVMEEFAHWQNAFPVLKTITHDMLFSESKTLTHQQKLLLAWFTALNTRKDILLLDQAFTGLDDTTIEKVWQQIPDYTIVLVVSNVNYG